jgi:hypothetical protein
MVQRRGPETHDSIGGIALKHRLRHPPSICEPVLPIMPAISSSKPYRVGRSRTGLGLFATQEIKKGTRIIPYVGRMLDCNKKKHDDIENKYLFQITNRWTIDGSVRSNVARYINHACKPNAESDVSKRKRTVTIRAIKTIQPGDEINYDYGTEYFKSYLKPIGCKCAACEKKRKKLRAEEREAKKRAKARAEKKAAKADLQVKGAAAKSSKPSPKAVAKVGNAKRLGKPVKGRAAVGSTRPAPK